MLKSLLPSALMLFSATAMAQSTLSIGIKKENMNLQAKPGNDFFEYADGGWNKAHPLTAEYSRYGVFNALDEENNTRLRTLIENTAAQAHAMGSTEQKIGDLFNLAMDSTRKNAEGFNPLRPLYESIYGVQTMPEFILKTGELARKGVGAFMVIYVGADEKNSKQNIVQLHQGGLSLGQKEYYLDNDEATTKIRNAFKNYVVRLFVLCGDDEATAMEKRDNVMKVETAIAKTSRSRTELRDPERNYNKMSYAALLNSYPGIDWSTLLMRMGFPAFNEICVGQPEAIAGIESLLTDIPLSTLKDYLAFRLVNDAAANLSDDFREANFDFFGRTLSGKEQDRPLWKRAVSTVDDVLGEAVGKMYAQKYFPAASKERMTQLVKNLQTALGQRIDAQDWMSEATKKRAHEKLNTFYVKIGYPNKWRDYSALSIDKNQTFIENLWKASEFAFDNMIREKVNKPVDRDEWYMNPQTVNAYYNPTTNEICFPAGILQPPFFDMQADDAFNYGAIGVVIGHEMTHGFDDNGRQYDKDGNLRDWWEPQDGERFKERAKVMADFFSNIKVLPDLNGNGQLTLGENLADHGGLQVAYQALQNAMAESPLQKAEGFTPEQRFFLAYAGVWAGNIRDEQIRVYTKSDPHSLGRWRVNGALPHIDAWYKAFGVTKKDKLFIPKAKRVTIW